METTPTNFEKKKTARKGAFAELLVKRRLEEKGYQVMGNESSGAHPFDFLASKNKVGFFAVDVKAKARRRKYPDTGINTKHLNTYFDFSKNHNMEFRIYFVDEENSLIYGNTLGALQLPKTINGINYPLRNSGMSKYGTYDITYFPVDNMDVIGGITDEERKKLIELTTKNQKYKPS